MRYWVLLIVWSALSLVQAQAPRHAYVTWQSAPSTSLTVNAQTAIRAGGLAVYYDTAPQEGRPEAYRYRAQGTAHQIDGLADGRWVHWIELVDLEPDTPYYFVIGTPEGGFSREYAVRTLPADDRPVRFVAGGDLGVGDDMRRLLRHAATYAPRFALIGGDIAYVNGNLDRVATWDVWLDAWQEHMVTPEGFLIPLVLAVGNHEVQGGYDGGPERAPFYTGFFAQPGSPSYFRLPVGANAVIYTLDTGHIVPHEAQVGWLTEQMQADQHIPYRFASYHIPLYPSHRSYDGLYSERGRTHWGPVFDAHRLTAAFENHDHTFKRSKRLRGGASDDAGTLYLGDGAWGRGGRTVDLSPRWYLDKAGANRHVWVVDVSTEGVVYRAFDTEGVVFDVYPPDAEGAAEADAYFQTLPQLYALGEGTLVVEPLAPLSQPFQSATVYATIHNAEAYPADVAVQFEVEAPLEATPAAAAFSLAPGDSAGVAFVLSARALVADDLFPPASLRATFAFDRGEAGPARVDLVQRVAAEQAFVAPPRGRAVTLDGDLDEWSALPYRFTQAARHDEGTGAWQGPQDASLHFAVAYDATQLYLALRVTDDQVVTTTGEALWDAAHERTNGDAVLLWLDPHPGGEGDDDPYLALAPGAAGSPARLVAADDDWHALAEAARVAGKRDAEGYVLEVAVPLALLGSDQLDAIRLNLALSDVDLMGEAPDVVYWRPQWESDGDYEGFGVVMLQR